MIVIGQALALALAGRIEDATTVCARGLKLEPNASIRTIRELGYIPALEEKMIRGARRLGLPELVSFHSGSRQLTSVVAFPRA